MPPSPIHLIVRLPYNRPPNAPDDPVKIEWSQEKETILWEVVTKMRATEGAEADWKGLSNHLEVPLPYLLYRAQVRYEEDLKGIQDIHRSLAPQTQNAEKLVDNQQPTEERHLSLREGRSSTPRAAALKLAISGRMSASSLRTPTSRRVERPLLRRGSSQTLTGTLQQKKLSTGQGELRPQSRLSSDEEDLEEEERLEKEERKEEEQEALGRRLKELERLMTGEMLGLVQKPRAPSRSASVMSEPKSVTSPLRRSSSLVPGGQSESSSVSPQGSIPSIPSPVSGSQNSSQILQTRRLKPAATSPARSPLISPSFPRGQPQMKFGNVGRTRVSEKGSTQGSTTSSFSDISEADVSASALESALMSNIRGGSRLSVFTRGRFGSSGFKGAL